ncbi:MAG TPA: excinuclease ABC subunit UvrA [Saprospiraceae bacterium]|nr:excinuclease ABC subunit UvrA [Saprospiraceae bacterium]
MPKSHGEEVALIDDNQDSLKEFIHIKGARTNNLKNVELRIEKNNLIVVTGLSGSGKSTLIMDTLYAEGQRRYVESLSSYARQFLDKMKKPEVDFIRGICPAIAIEQRVSSSNSRSTVGSLTEIYDYLRLMFARIGKTYSPISGEEVKKHEVQDVVDYILSFDEEQKVQLFIPFPNKEDRTFLSELDLLLQKGFTRISMSGELIQIEDIISENNPMLSKSCDKIEGGILVLIDRFTCEKSDENKYRISDSVTTAFQEGEGNCIVQILGIEEREFNNRFELDGLIFPEPTPQLFNYNNPYGACQNCEGYGKVLGIDPAKVIPDETLSVYQDAVMAWRGEKGQEWLKDFINCAEELNFPIHKPYNELTEDQVDILWYGKGRWSGINAFFAQLEQGAYKIQNRVMLARYRGKTNCNECKGGRLRKEAQYIKVSGKSISQLIRMSIKELKHYIDDIDIPEFDTKVASRILKELKTRLDIMDSIGLNYLSIDRAANSLSGGETQRINLTRTLGSNLTNSMYILDEPSIGLHPKDTEKLVDVLKNLRDMGNTVIVVEHEEAVINSADFIVDVGPLAGINGGEIVFSGTLDNLKKKAKNSLTADYITHRRNIPLPKIRRPFTNKIEILGAKQHNLKNINVTIPLNAMTVVSGVSGSGKTSLIMHILYPEMKRLLGEASGMNIGKHDKITGDWMQINQVELVNQSPIGKSSRSNPVTYIKAYDAIRKLFAKQQLSKIRGYEAGHFSFNIDGGRCETCNGDGSITVEMQFLADVNLVCEDCNGKRFKKEILEVKYKDKNIFDILELSVDEALEFFSNIKEIATKLQPLADVGLAYVKLGQSSSTLSGGEAQRVKLASFLAKENSSQKMMFIFDEPTTGLHFHDVLKLLDAFNALVENGHTVVIVEHNLDVMKNADWLIDLGPVGGKEGGNLLYQGVPEGIVKVKDSYTAEFLKEKFEN